MASAATGPIAVAASAGYNAGELAVCAAPLATAKPGSGGTSTGIVERSSAATESRSSRWPTNMTRVAASGTCCSTVAAATAAPAVPIGAVASTDVDSASSSTTVSAAVSSAANSSAASAPALRANAAAASASVTTSTLGTPASATLWRRVSACDSSGRQSRVAATWLPDSATERQVPTIVSARSVSPSSARSRAYWSSTSAPLAEGPISANRATGPATATPRTTSTDPLRSCLATLPSYRRHYFACLRKQK
ncbi:hypothetical protein CQY20_30040 [Mycolicibacterium agri]|uniref:Uncharacterized protein n=1 Tax=Mycolicibacterium agri TaxID=36811 RepID=A0A2A7MPW8_MYCAG|nr:hypothetical protein CQY20_30040 [Mycolicibacterium agri]